MGKQKGKLVLTAFYFQKDHPIFLFKKDGKRFVKSFETKQPIQIDDIDFIDFLKAIQRYWMQKGQLVDLDRLIALFDEIDFDM